MNLYLKAKDAQKYQFEISRCWLGHFVEHVIYMYINNLKALPVQVQCKHNLSINWPIIPSCNRVINNPVRQDNIGNYFQRFLKFLMFIYASRDQWESSIQVKESSIIVLIVYSVQYFKSVGLIINQISKYCTE